MAIIIPSKKIYEINNPKVVENALSKIDIVQDNISLKQDDEKSEKLSEILSIDNNVSEPAVKEKYELAKPYSPVYNNETQEHTLWGTWKFKEYENRTPASPIYTYLDENNVYSIEFMSNDEEWVGMYHPKGSKTLCYLKKDGTPFLVCTSDGAYDRWISPEYQIISIKRPQYASKSFFDYIVWATEWQFAVLLGSKTQVKTSSSTIRLDRKKSDYYIANINPTIEVEFDVVREEMKVYGHRGDEPKIDFDTPFAEILSTSESYAKNYNENYDLSVVNQRDNSRSETRVSVIDSKILADFSVVSENTLIYKNSWQFTEEEIAKNYPSKAEITRETKDYYTLNATFASELDVWVAQSTDRTDEWNDVSIAWNYAISALHIKMRAKSAKIIYGETVRYLDIQSDNITLENPVAKGNATFSVKDNPFVNKQNQYLGASATRQLFNHTLNTYVNGKETVRLLCSIGEYKDENGDVVVSTLNNQKMLIEHYDKIVPMIRNGDGFDEAMSYNANGTAKVFEVVGANIIADGALWQELVARESGESIEIPSAEKLASPTIAISTSILTIVDNSGKAEKIDILIDGELRKTLDAQSVVYFDLEELNLDYGSYKVTVIVRANDYIQSSQSNIITYNKENPEIETLNAPTIMLEGDTLYIYGDTENAEKFEVWVNGFVKTTTTNTQVLLTNLNLGIGTFTIFVIAKAKGYNDSPQSNTLTYIFERKTKIDSGKYVFDDTPSFENEISQDVITKIVLGSNEYDITRISIGASGIMFTTNQGNIIAHNGTDWISEDMKYIEFTETIQVTTTFYDWFTRNSEKQKISFSINDKEQVAEYDMSWYQWCNSSYNVDRWLVNANNAGERIYRPISAAIVESIFDSDKMVYATDKIIENGNYTSRETFSSNISSDEILDYVEENYYDKKYIDTTIDTKEQVLQKIKEALIDYATKTWVNDNFATEQEVKDSIRFALETWAEDNLSGYVTDAELENALVETLESFGIEHTITESGEETLHIEGYATRTEMSATIEEKLGQFSVEYNKKFDSLSFGGRNLYTNSSDFSGSKWVNLDVWSKDTNLDSYGNVIMYKVGQWGGIHQIINAKAEDVYTLSATVFGDGACWGHFYASEYNSSGYLTHSSQVKNYEPSKLKSSGTRVYATYTVKTDCTLSFRIENSTEGAKIKISSLKLERGTNPTDWTKAPEDTDEEFVKLSTDFSKEINDIKNQIDGVVDTWFGNEAPTLTNEPAVNWTTEEAKQSHLGDTYYDNITGYGYRWQINDGTYLWVEISNSAAVKALEIASKAQDTADGKRRVFVTTPYPPYDVGDLWTVTTTEGQSGDLMRCAVARGSGSYVVSDWVKATKYIDQQEADESANDKVQRLQIGGRNLAYYTDNLNCPIIHSGVTINSGNTPLSHRWNLTKGSEYIGTLISAQTFEVGETYTISYFIRKTSGTLLNIGGHISAFTQNRLSIDGKETPLLYANGVPISDDTAVHYIVLTVKYNGNTDTNALYIQPNRGFTTLITYDLWNIKVEKGEKATDWTPAWEEYYTTVENDAKIKVLDDRITQEVSQITTTLQNSYYTKTQIDQTAYSITQSVTAVDTKYGKEISRVEGSIALGIGKDGSGNAYSYLKGNAGYISFTGNKFTVNSDNLSIGLDGTINANNGIFRGEIHATSGDIGGVQIGNFATKSEVSTAGATATSNAVSAIEQKGYATTGQVNTAKNEAISAAASDATSKANSAQTNAINTASADATQKANNAKASAVTEVKGLGYQTAPQVTQITKDTITTSYVNALKITAQIANIANAITVGNVFSANEASGSVKIGTYNVGQYWLESSDTNVGMCSEPNHERWAFWAGTEASYGDKAFRVGHSGALIAMQANIKGHIEATSGYFSGELRAATGDFEGEVRANSGKIANWNIAEGALTAVATDANVLVSRNGRLYDFTVTTTTKISTVGLITSIAVKVNSQGDGVSPDAITASKFEEYYGVTIPSQVLVRDFTGETKTLAWSILRQMVI